MHTHTQKVYKITLPTASEGKNKKENLGESTY